MYRMEIELDLSGMPIEARGASTLEYRIIALLSEWTRRNRIVWEGQGFLYDPETSSDDRVRLTVLAPFTDALDAAYDSETDAEARRDLESMTGTPLRVRCLSEDLLYPSSRAVVATGKEAEDYALFIYDNLLYFSPVRCGHCFGAIPLYLLPELPPDTMTALIEWRADAYAFARMHRNFSVGEQYAHRMMASAQSPLNQAGLKLCRQLEEALGKPVYLYLYRFEGRHPTRCPLCGGRWKRPVSEDSFYDYRCDACRLVADEPVHRGE